MEHRLARRSALAGRARRCCALDGADDAVNYTTVYLIERSLSLDNLFVFLLLFAYFGVPERAPRAAAVLGHRRGARRCAALAILGGVALHRAVPLRHLRARRAAARARLPDPARRRARTSTRTATSSCALVRRVCPVSGDFHGARWFVREDGRRCATPLFLCLAGDRRGRHRVRGRLDPGRVRDHARLGADLDGATSSRCSACARCSCSSRG